MVRAGKLLSILTSEEIEKLQEQRDFEAFIAAVMRGLDDDEYFYLAAMRDVIDSCEQPFYQRKATLEGISARLDGLRETPRYPLFAASVLLVSLAKGQRSQALDRARCEAWSLALATATGQPVATPPVNPVTGDVFTVTQTDERIEIREIDGRPDGESVIVPVPSGSQRGSRHTID